MTARCSRERSLTIRRSSRRVCYAVGVTAADIGLFRLNAISAATKKYHVAACVSKTCVDLGLLLVRRLRDTIVHFVIKAPKLAHLYFYIYKLI